MDAVSILTINPQTAGSNSSVAEKADKTSTRNPSPVKDNYEQVSSYSNRATSYLDRTLRILMRKPLENSEKLCTNTLEASINDKGQTVVKTEDGYEVTFLGARQEFTIKASDGKTTTIWGDPHVVESDGDKWDFTDKSSFVFGNNKLTVETTPAGNGATYSKTVTIYNQNDRFTISGLDKNKPIIEAWSFDGKEHDESLSDGTTYHLSKEASGDDIWQKTKPSL